MARKWYRNPYYWFAIFAFLFPFYTWLYQTRGYVREEILGLLGLITNILNHLHISSVLVTSILGVLYMISFAVVALSIIFLPLWIIALIIWNKVDDKKAGDKQKEEQKTIGDINREIRGYLKKLSKRGDKR